jgi:hypothetical protein
MVLHALLYFGSFTAVIILFLDVIAATWWLRANGKRPRRSCTTQNTQKFSPPHVHPKAQKAASYRLKGVL